MYSLLNYCKESADSLSTEIQAFEYFGQELRQTQTRPYSWLGAPHLAGRSLDRDALCPPFCFEVADRY